jgi:uncharacterized membrane protein HdeD (DUF308 family)
MDKKPIHNTPSMQTANEEGIYKLLLVGIILGVIGVFLRFAGDSDMLSIISWIILFIGAAVCFKGIFKILGA